jgi:hypothetical protein
LKYLVAGLVVFLAEDAIFADRSIFALGADFFPIDKQRDVFHDKFKCLRHWFFQRPCNPSQYL